MAGYIGKTDENIEKGTSYTERLEKCFLCQQHCR